MSKTEEVNKNKIHAPLSGVVESITELKIPDIGVGRMTTTATRILMDLMIEDGIEERLNVLESVIDYLKIEPEDFNKMRRNDKKHEMCDYDNDEKYSWE